MKAKLKSIFRYLLGQALYFCRIMLYPPDHLHGPQTFYDEHGQPVDWREEINEPTKQAA